MWPSTFSGTASSCRTKRSRTTLRQTRSSRRSWSASPCRPVRSRVMLSSASTPERTLRRLDWTIVRRLDGLLPADYRTIVRGQGLALADIREYVAGDDVRNIDWHVTARPDPPHLRE